MKQTGRGSATSIGDTIPVTRSSIDALSEEMERMHRAIMERAYEIFCARGSEPAPECDDWLEAERALVRRPSIALSRKGDRLELLADVAGLEPAQLDVRVSPERVLIQATAEDSQLLVGDDACICEFASGTLHRAVDLPAAVDPNKATATCRHGLLRLDLPLAAAPKKAPARKKTPRTVPSPV